MAEAFLGVIWALVGGLLLAAAYDIGNAAAEREVKRKCEQYQVVDLPQMKSMFYCSREPIK